MSDFTDYVYFASTNSMKSGRRIYRLTRELIWEVGSKGSGNKIVIEKGFLTDFLSVPPSLKFFLDNDGLYAAAGALHDKLYRTKEGGRKFADRQLYDGLIALKCNKYIAWYAWFIVRLGGWKFYGRDNFKEYLKENDL